MCNQRVNTGSGSAIAAVGRIRRRSSRLLLGLACGVAILGPAAPAAADDLFRVTVVGTDDTVSVGSSSLLDLAESVADQSGQFTVFEGQAFTASFDYAGLENAILLSSNADNSEIVLNIPATGFTRTFNEADGDLEDQVRDFLKSDGGQALADFYRVVNEQTLVGVTDGNPSALTALISGETFRLFGDFRNPFGQHPLGADGLRLYANYGRIDTDAGDGHMIEGALTSSFRFTNHVGLVLDTLGSYRSIEGSETFTIAGIVGLPIRVTGELSDERPFLWQITPSAYLGGGGSADQLSGGLIIGGGVTNLLGLKVGDFFISSGQQLGLFDGQPISVSDYEFETEVDQTIFRGSVAVTYGGIGQSAYLQGGVMYTTFLEDAAVDNWVTPFVGLGLRLGRGVLRAGYSADLSDDFNMHRVEAELRFAL